ncbi:putative disease resistance RPP8-like protein 2 [Bienertia sinuspersici]
MADNIITSLVQQLGSLALEEYEVLRGVRDELKSLENELIFMKKFLRNSEGKHEEHDLVKELVDQIKEVAFEAEDVIETFLLNAERQKHRTAFWKVVHSLGHAVMTHKMANKIDGIKKKINDVYANKEKVTIIHCGYCKYVSKPREVRKNMGQNTQDVSLHLSKDEAYLDILASSYHNLPVELKPCFLYFAVFPEDYAMPVQRLIALWLEDGAAFWKKLYTEYKLLRVLDFGAAVKVEIVPKDIDDLTNLRLARFEVLHNPKVKNLVSTKNIYKATLGSPDMFGINELEALHEFNFKGLEEYHRSVKILTQLRWLFVKRFSCRFGCSGDIFTLPSLKDIQVLWPSDHLADILECFKLENTIKCRLLVHKSD